jgi:hypothetical protein
VPDGKYGLKNNVKTRALERFRRLCGLMKKANQAAQKSQIFSPF